MFGISKKPQESATLIPGLRRDSLHQPFCISKHPIALKRSGAFFLCRLQFQLDFPIARTMIETSLAFPQEANMPRFGLHAAVACALICATSCTQSSPSAETPTSPKDTKPAGKLGAAEAKPPTSNGANPPVVVGVQSNESGNSADGKDSGQSIDDLLKIACDRCKNAKSIVVDVETSMVLKAGNEEKRQSTSNRKFSVERPNRFAFRSAAGESSDEAISDGKTLFLRRVAQKKYNSKTAPKTLDQFASENARFDWTLEAGNFAAGIALSILGSDPYAGIMQGVMLTEDLGTEEIAGEKLRHIRVVPRDDHEWDVWLTSGKTPAFRKISVNLSKNFGGAAAGAGGTQLTGDVVFRNWKFDVPVDKSEFVPTLAEGRLNADKK